MELGEEYRHAQIEPTLRLERQAVWECKYAQTQTDPEELKQSSPKRRANRIPSSRRIGSARDHTRNEPQDGPGERLEDHKTSHRTSSARHNHRHPASTSGLSPQKRPQSSQGSYPSPLRIHGRQSPNLSAGLPPSTEAGAIDGESCPPKSNSPVRRLDPDRTTPSRPSSPYLSSVEIGAGLHGTS